MSFEVRENRHTDRSDDLWELPDRHKKSRPPRIGIIILIIMLLLAALTAAYFIHDHLVRERRVAEWRASLGSSSPDSTSSSDAGGSGSTDSSGTGGDDSGTDDTYGRDIDSDLLFTQIAAARLPWPGGLTYHHLEETKEDGNTTLTVYLKGYYVPQEAAFYTCRQFLFDSSSADTLVITLMDTDTSYTFRKS